MFSTMIVVISNESSLIADSPVFTLVPDTLYHLLQLEQWYNNPKYSVVTKMPGVPFSNENSGYSLRCSTFTQTINWPFDAFYDEELRRTIYGINTQGANIHDVNINNALEIMKSVKNINIHSGIANDNIVRNAISKGDIIETTNLVTDTTFNSFFDSVITNSNTIIDSANAIIDSANSINKSAMEIIYNSCANIYQINEVIEITYDTIRRASNNITRHATKVIRNSNDYNTHGFSIYGPNVHGINIRNANEIMAAADIMISEANTMISEANNDINLAKRACKKFEVWEPSHDWSNWEYIKVPVTYTAVTLTVCAMSAHLCKLAWVFFN